MTHLRIVDRFACLLALVLAGLVGSAGIAMPAVAQAGGSYTSPVSGAVIAATGPWAIDPDLSETGDGYDIVGLSSTTDGLLISFLPATIDVDEAQAIVLDEFGSGFDGFQQIDRGSYDNVTYSLDMASLEGVEFGVFSLFVAPQGQDFVRFSLFMAPSFAFGKGLASAQESVTVDGTPVFEGVASAGLQDLLDANAGITGGSSDPADAAAAGLAIDGTPKPNGTPVPTATAAPTASGGDGRDARRLPGEASTPTSVVENESETGRGGRQLPKETDYSALGLVEEGKYVSPQFDTEILWDETWTFDTSLDEPILSDTREEVDSLTLVWNGEDFVLIYVDIVAADGNTPADYVELWTSADYLAEVADPKATVLLQEGNAATGAVLLRDYLSGGEEIRLLREAISLDGGETLAIVTLIGFPETFADAYADASADITIAGEPGVSVFTPRQIERAQ